MTRDTPKRRHLVLLVGILVIAAGLRLYDLKNTPPGLYAPEAINGINALEVIRTGDYRVYYDEDQGREGLFVAILTVFLRCLPPDEPWVLRLPPALFGTATVAAVYLLGRVLFSVDVALFSSLFVATGLWHLFFSRIAFRVFLAPLLIVLALALLLMALRRREGNVATHLSAVAGGLFFGLGFYSYIAYRVAPLLLIPFIPQLRRRPLVAASFLLTALLVALPIGIFFAQHPDKFSGRMSQVSVFRADDPLSTIARNVIGTVGMFFVSGDWNWRHNFSGTPALAPPVALLFLAGIAYGMWRWSFAFALLFVWVAVGFVPVILTSDGIPHAMRSLLMMPAVMLLAGVAAAACWSRYYPRFPRASAATVAVLTVFLLGHTFVTYFVRWKHHPSVPDSFDARVAQIGESINALPDDAPKYVVLTSDAVDANNLPQEAFPIMYITGTHTPEGRAAKRVSYVVPDDAGRIPPGAHTFYIAAR